MSPSLEERIASLALSTFDSLPRKCKPRTDPKTGVKEWIPMSAIILAQNSNSNDEMPPVLHLVSLATGSKCLPVHHLPRSQGLVLHDSHSEILAIRGLNRVLLNEAYNILTADQSNFLIRNPKYNPNRIDKSDDGGEDIKCQGFVQQPFVLRPNLTIHLFSTEAPCGDASMEFIMSAQQDATPWPVPDDLTLSSLSLSNPVLGPINHSSNPDMHPNGLETQSQNSSPTPLPGRSFFSTLSIVRRKPARADAPLTLSKSCTDKLSLKQFTSVLSSISSLIVVPNSNTYISTFTVPHNKFNDAGYKRAFSPEGRLKNVFKDPSSNRRTGKYTLVPFKAIPLPQSFNYTYQYSKPSTDLDASSNVPEAAKSKASNLSALYLCNSTSTGPTTTVEVLISGVKQGNQQFSTSEDDRKGSVVCRKKMWKLTKEIAELLGDEKLLCMVKTETYGDLKGSYARQPGDGRDRDLLKSIVVDTLGGWERNRGDDDWGL